MTDPGATRSTAWERAISAWRDAKVISQAMKEETDVVRSLNRMSTDTYAALPAHIRRNAAALKLVAAGQATHEAILEACHGEWPPQGLVVDPDLTPSGTLRLGFMSATTGSPEDRASRVKRLAGVAVRDHAEVDFNGPVYLNASKGPRSLAAGILVHEHTHKLQMRGGAPMDMDEMAQPFRTAPADLLNMPTGPFASKVGYLARTCEIGARIASICADVASSDGLFPNSRITFFTMMMYHGCRMSEKARRDVAQVYGSAPPDLFSNLHGKDIDCLYEVLPKSFPGGVPLDEMLDEALVGAYADYVHRLGDPGIWKRMGLPMPVSHRLDLVSRGRSDLVPPGDVVSSVTDAVELARCMVTTSWSRPHSDADWRYGPQMFDRVDAVIRSAVDHLVTDLMANPSSARRDDDRTKAALSALILDERTPPQVAKMTAAAVLEHPCIDPGILTTINPLLPGKLREIDPGRMAGLERGAGVPAMAVELDRFAEDVTGLTPSGGRGRSPGFTPLFEASNVPQDQDTGSLDPDVVLGSFRGRFQAARAKIHAAATARPFLSAPD